MLERFKKLNIFLIILVFLIVPNFSSVKGKAPNLKDSFDSKKYQDKLTSFAEQGGYVVGGEASTVERFISVAIMSVLSILAVLFLAFMIYGGYIWMTAHGNEENVKKAINIIKNALIGLIIVVAAYAVSYYIIDKLTTKNFNYKIEKN